MATAAVRIGVIADIQYADCEDGTDFSGAQRRTFRGSLSTARRATASWEAEGGLAVLAQLGDLLDGRAVAQGTRDQDCAAVLATLTACPAEQRVNLIGNHELYNWERTELGSVLGTQDPSSGRSWYSLLVGPSLRVLVLDSYEVSLVGGVTPANTATAHQLLSQHNPAALVPPGKIDWSIGLTGLDLRWMPYNGAVGPTQLAWLGAALAAARQAAETVLVLSHVPLCPAAADPRCLLWNYGEVLDLLEGAGCVTAVLAGHDHEGGWAVQAGVTHLTLPSPLLGDTGAWATLTLQQDCLHWAWHGQKLPASLNLTLTGSRR